MRPSPIARALLPALAFGLAVVLAIVLAACGGIAPSAPSTTPVPTAVGATSGPTGGPTQAPEPTAVPGGQTPGESEPVATPAATTQTDWGAITDALPEGFPVFPGATVAEPPAEPASGAFIATAGVDEVATWYRDALEATGQSTLDLSTPLEDGSRVLDMQGDLPECRVRLTFRPAGGSTMIIVLVGAGCAGGEG